MCGYIVYTYITICTVETVTENLPIITNTVTVLLLF
jgi:hypothetical protein